MIKNHFPTVKIIETTLAKILDKLGVSTEFGSYRAVSTFVYF